MPEATSLLVTSHYRPTPSRDHRPTGPVYNLEGIVQPSEAVEQRIEGAWAYKKRAA